MGQTLVGPIGSRDIDYLPMEVQSEELRDQGEPSTSGQMDVAREYIEHMKHVDDLADKPLRVIQVTVQ